ncbi:MAG: hypothetical protein NDI62_01290 [Burkholderiales bacterium]|nr:hypothetical protein [Burkholderiales bacterium]
MYESIINFNKQFSYKPEIVNADKLEEKSSFIVIGMGGSVLAPLLIKTCKPEIDILIERDYCLPKLNSEELKNKTIILSSYSGNTEEVITAYNEAKDKNLNISIITAGGKLLSLAKENNTPYIELPNTGIQPRMALGLFTKAFLKIMKVENDLKQLTTLENNLNPKSFEEKGKALAEKIKNFVPVIYTSNKNTSLAYIWKIKLNETGKIPAFCNVLPELNHNEMTGFDMNNLTKELSSKFYFIILKDKNDNPKIIKRMEVLEKLYKDRNLSVETIELEDEKEIWEKCFSALLLADFTAYYTAIGYGSDPEQVPMVEEFKKLILE